MFDWVLTQIQHKFQEAKQTIEQFVWDCQVQVNNVIKKLGIDSEKTKKNVEQSVIATYINQRMETKNSQQFTNAFKHKNLFQVFVKNNTTGFRSAKEFEAYFVEVMKPELTSNKYNSDYTSKLEKEMGKFNQKLVGDGTETNSEATSATKLTKKSGSQGDRKPSQRDGSPGLDEVDEAAAMDGGGDDKDLPEEESEVDQAMAEKLAKQKEEEQNIKSLFVDPHDRTPFNPEKKFGVIESNSLLYDEITTSYPLNLPAEYYQRVIA